MIDVEVRNPKSAARVLPPDSDLRCFLFERDPVGKHVVPKPVILWGRVVVRGKYLNHCPCKWVFEVEPKSLREWFKITKLKYNPMERYTCACAGHLIE